MPSTIHGPEELKKSINGLITNCGYEYVSKKTFTSMKGKEQAIYTEQYGIGTNIYGKAKVAPFILYHPTRWKQCLVIEAKWQQGGGTVDQKYPFLVLCIKKSRHASIIVLDGGGYSSGAEAWLKGQAGSSYLKEVMNMRQLAKYATDGHL